MGNGHDYQVGEPVWVRMDGYPWWPARVVTLEQACCVPGGAVPKVTDDECLVEFFNDNKRNAITRRSNMRPFLNPRYNKINMRYSGHFLEDLNIAIREARAYVQEQGLTYKQTRSNSSAATKRGPEQPPAASSDRQVRRKGSSDVEMSFHPVPKPSVTSDVPPPPPSARIQLNSKQSRSPNTPHTISPPSTSTEIAALRDAAQCGVLSSEQLYSSMSNAELVQLLSTYEKMVRDFRARDLRLATKDDPNAGVTSMEDLIWMCAPAFAEVKDFITMSQSGADKLEKEMAEKRAMGKLHKLMSRPIQSSLLREQHRVMKRGIKLATEAVPHSMHLAHLMRELCIQWLDIAASQNPS